MVDELRWSVRERFRCLCEVVVPRQKPYSLVPCEVWIGIPSLPAFEKHSIVCEALDVPDAKAPHHVDGDGEIFPFSDKIFPLSTNGIEQGFILAQDGNFSDLDQRVG
jgi:hypothetical protein